MIAYKALSAINNEHIYNLKKQKIHKSESNLDHSIIISDDGGMYLLLNSLTKEDKDVVIS